MEVATLVATFALPPALVAMGWGKGPYLASFTGAGSGLGVWRLQALCRRRREELTKRAEGLADQADGLRARVTVAGLAGEAMRQVISRTSPNRFQACRRAMETQA